MSASLFEAFFSPLSDRDSALFPLPGRAPVTRAILPGIVNRLARFKRPRLLVTVTVLSCNAMGNAQENVLRERFVGYFASDGRQGR